MSKVIYNGISITRNYAEIYRDTLLLPFISDDGMYGLENVPHNQFDRYYSSTQDSISWRTANYLSNLGFNILSYRHQPWKTDIKVSKSVDSLGTPISLKISDFDIGNLGYIKITLYPYTYNKLGNYVKIGKKYLKIDNDKRYHIRVSADGEYIFLPGNRIDE